MKDSPLEIILQVELVRPYGQSLGALLEMANIWRCHLVKVSPSKPMQVIKMPWKSFKKIWGTNPKKGVIEIPSGTEFFITSIRILDIQAT